MVLATPLHNGQTTADKRTDLKSSFEVLQVCGQDVGEKKRMYVREQGNMGCKHGAKQVACLTVSEPEALHDRQPAFN